MHVVKNQESLNKTDRSLTKVTPGQNAILAKLICKWIIAHSVEKSTKKSGTDNHQTGKFHESIIHAVIFPIKILSQAVFLYSASD